MGAMVESRVSGGARRQLERIRFTAGLVIFSLLVAGLFLVVRPFFVPIAWALIVVLTTWPVCRRLRRFRLSPGAAAALMTGTVLAAVFLVVVPVLLSLFAELSVVALDAQKWWSVHEHAVPAMIGRLPLLGDYLQENYHELWATGEGWLKSLFNYRPGLLGVATSAAQGIFELGLELFVWVVSLFFLFRRGRRIALGLNELARSIGGEATVHLIQSTTVMVKATVYGLLATAMVQGVLAGIGYFIAGAPVPVLLSSVTMLSSLLPYGPPLVYLPVAGYLMLRGAVGFGTFLLVWGVVVVSLSDNIVRPYFISKATRLPMILILLGVLGGLLAFGLLGVFVGPLLIVVVHSVWREVLASAELPDE